LSLREVLVVRDDRVRWALWLVLVLTWGGVTPLLIHAGLSGESPGDRFMRWRDSLEIAEHAADDGDLKVAEAHYREVIDDAEDPRQANVLLARALDGLADVRRAQQNWSEAEGLYLRSAEMWESLLGPDQPRLATTLHNLGVVYLHQDKAREAEVALQRALALWERALGQDSIEAENTRRIYDQARSVR
jgi:tetratricopeptide (TPR) repeat protein